MEKNIDMDIYLEFYLIHSVERFSKWVRKYKRMKHSVDKITFLHEKICFYDSLLDHKFEHKEAEFVRDKKREEIQKCIIYFTEEFHKIKHISTIAAEGVIKSNDN